MPPGDSDVRDASNSPAVAIANGRPAGNGPITGYFSAASSIRGVLLQIASRLDITEGTVKIHLHNIYQKLGIKNRTALAVQLMTDRT